MQEMLIKAGPAKSAHKSMPETLIKVDLTQSAYDNDMIHNRWHPDVPMVAWVNPGEDFIVETYDWTGGFIKNNDSADDVRDIDWNVTARLGDELDDAVALLACPPLQLGFQHRMASRGHRNLFHGLSRASASLLWGKKTFRPAAKPDWEGLITLNPCFAGRFY